MSDGRESVLHSQVSPELFSNASIIWEMVFSESIEKTCVILFPDSFTYHTYMESIILPLNILFNASMSGSLILSTKSTLSLQLFTGRGIVTLVFFDNANLKAIQDKLLTLLKRLRDTKIVFVSMEPFQSARIKELFKWCWKASMLNVILFDSVDNKVYSYIPFGKFYTYKIAKNSSNSEYFPNKLTNLQGEVFRTVSEVFSPTAFLYTNLKGEHVLGGFSGRIFASYVERRNGKMKHRQLLSKDVKHELNDLFLKKSADIALHLYDGIEPDLYDRSMIITFGQWCALVPASKYLPAYMNLIQPFETDIWMLIIFGVFYATILLRIASHISGERGSLSRMLLYVLQTFIYQMGMKRISLMKKKFLIVYAPLILLGLILNHLYLSHVSSYLTNPLRGKGIKTAQDFHRENIRILGVWSELEKYILKENGYKDYHDLLTGVNRQDLYRWREQFNNTNAIMTESDKIYHILMQQKYMENEIFSHPRICFRNLAYAYPVRHDFPYMFDFEHHLKLVSKAGLIAKWRRDGFEESRQAGFVPKIRKFSAKRKILNLNHVQMPFRLLAIGYVMSLLCFVFEIAIKWSLERFHFGEIGIFRRKRKVIKLNV